MLEEKFNGAQVVSNVFTGDSKRLSCTYPGGRVISSTFDAIDRVKTIGDAGGVIATSNWIGPGMRELRRVNKNGTQLSFLNAAGNAADGYDAVKRIVRLKCLLPGGTAFVDREYGYNRADVRTFERRGADGGQEDRFSYDSLYRVVATALDQGGTGTKRDLQTIGYQLDGVGNRRSVARTTGSGGLATEAVSVNAMNEYTAVGGTARAHSDNGNLRDDGRNTYVFDYKNRLIGAFDKATGNPTAAYLYYCDNRRAKKIVYSQASPGQVQSQERYFYDGSQVVEETDDPGNTLLTWVYSVVYVDEPVQMVRTGTHSLGAGTFYLHQNARADVVAVTDAAGAVVERRLFDDYGRAFDGVTKQAVSGSAVGNPYGFQGRRLDSESGLLYFRARYYDPATGRFVQRDPVWDPGNFGNQYSFVGNGPISGLDPSGLSPDGAFRKLEREVFTGSKVAFEKLQQQWRRQGKLTKTVQAYITRLSEYHATVGKYQDYAARAKFQDDRRNRFLTMQARAEGLGLTDAAERYGRAAQRRYDSWEWYNDLQKDYRKKVKAAEKALHKAHTKLTKPGRQLVASNKTLDMKLRTLRVLTVLSGMLLAYQIHKNVNSLKRMNALTAAMSKGKWNQVACWARSPDFRRNFLIEYAALAQQAGAAGSKLGVDVMSGTGRQFLDNVAHLANTMVRKQRKGRKP